MLPRCPSIGASCQFRTGWRASKNMMASRTMTQVRLALCQKHLTMPAAVSSASPAAASYHKIAFRTRHVAALSASRSACRAGRASFATQVSLVLPGACHAMSEVVFHQQSCGPWCAVGLVHDYSVYAGTVRARHKEGTATFFMYYFVCMAVIQCARGCTYLQQLASDTHVV